jgi:G protein-coupled receptor kinase interactor 2
VSLLSRRDEIFTFFVYQMVTLLYAKGANLLWEHTLFHPANASSGVTLGKTNVKRKPSPKDPIHPNKSEFIRAKYQLQSFIHRPAKDEPQCSCDDLSQVRNAEFCLLG